MFCNKCGDPIRPNEKFCSKCGNPIDTNKKNDQIPNNSKNNVIKSLENLDDRNRIIIGVGIGFVLLILIVLGVHFSSNSSGRYYFGENPNKPDTEVPQTPEEELPKRGKYETAIIYDNTYTGVKLTNIKDANKLIVKDSVSQKSKCPKEIKKIEEEIIKDYGITAVNLCEMDVNFAKEIGNVFKRIYNEYPSVRGYLTNLSLANVDMNNNYIAAFMPMFTFATADTDTEYPWAMKTQVLLNTSYFLNPERLKSSVEQGSNSGHFPKNATMYSPVAHELGHYLSFLAMMNNHNVDSIRLIEDDDVNDLYDLITDFGLGNFSLEMIKEAYENYKKDHNTTMSLDEWRATISEYAMAKNNSGEYIYDETIAESFHDVYLNNDNAADASKYVVAVLKKKLEG
ncbi:MAG: zinc-ribbon domain-containing protein [Bacilli bacterium]|nr:zinc-ribbon domain-containing protein [Bacilli bacterium]